MKATVTKGQVTIPLAIRRKRADHLKATKCVDVARMRSVIGIAKDEPVGKTVREWMDELRGPVDLPPSKGRR